MEKNYSVILFDGVCNFCNTSVNFILKRDVKNRFKFATFQSETGKKLLNQFRLDTKNLNTIFLIENGKYYTKTDAALRIAGKLKGLRTIFYIFIIVPPFIRNIGYSIIAKYRYGWFGKRYTCRIPAQVEKEKFLI